MKRLLVIVVLGLLVLGAAACAPDPGDPPPDQAAQTVAATPQGTVPWPYTPAPTQPGLWAVCEIKSTADEPAGAAFPADYYSVVGATSHPRGTVFTQTVTWDGNTLAVPIVAKAGSALIGGLAYGDPGSYDDVGQTNFGNTSDDMPAVAKPHGPVSVTVTLGDEVVCAR